MSVTAPASRFLLAAANSVVVLVTVTVVVAGTVVVWKLEQSALRDARGGVTTGAVPVTARAQLSALQAARSTTSALLTATTRAASVQTGMSILIKLGGL